MSKEQQKKKKEEVIYITYYFRPLRDTGWHPLQTNIPMEDMEKNVNELGDVDVTERTVILPNVGLHFFALKFPDKRIWTIETGWKKRAKI